MFMCQHNRADVYQRDIATWSLLNDWPLKTVMGALQYDGSGLQGGLDQIMGESTLVDVSTPMVG